MLYCAQTFILGSDVVLNTNSGSACITQSVYQHRTYNSFVTLDGKVWTSLMRFISSMDFHDFFLQFKDIGRNKMLCYTLRFGHRLLRFCACGFSSAVV